MRPFLTPGPAPGEQAPGSGLVHVSPTCTACLHVSLRLCLHLPGTGVMPNKETEFLLLQIFGRKSYPTREITGSQGAELGGREGV